MVALLALLALLGPGKGAKASTAAAISPSSSINGPAVQAALSAASSGATVTLPSQIVTLGPLHITKPLNIVCPSGGTIVYGSLPVAARPITLGDQGYSQISSSVVSSVQVVDLQSNGIPDAGPYALGPFGSGGNNNVSTAEAQLFSDDSPMYLSQWPTPGAVGGATTFATTTGYTGYTAIACSTLPSWSANDTSGNNRVIVHQYPTSYTESIDWYSSATISGTTMTLDTQVPSGFGTMGSSCRFYVQNVLEQLLLPGQYYISRNEQKIYFIPVNSSPHSYRLSLNATDLIHLDSGSDGTTFSGGPLILKHSRGSGMVSTANMANISLGNVYAYGCGEDSFYFPYLHSGWTCSSLTAKYCGGAGLWFGPTAGTTGSGSSITPPTLTSQASSFTNVYEDHCCQRCRSYRGGVHLNTVGVTVGQFTSLNNPNQALIWDAHDTTISNVWLDCSLMEGMDVGAIYSAQDPTTFGCTVNGLYCQNIPSGTSPKSVSNDRRGFYVDTLCSGVTLNNAVFSNCNSDYCVYWSGGQGNTIAGITTYNCSSSPVGMDDRGSTQTSFTPAQNSWWQSTGQAYYLVTNANALSGTPYSKYGTPWSSLLSGSPYLGIPRNCSITGIGIASSCTTGQTNYSIFFTGTTVNQPQGGLLPGSGTLLPGTTQPNSP